MVSRWARAFVNSSCVPGMRQPSRVPFAGPTIFSRAPRDSPRGKIRALALHEAMAGTPRPVHTNHERQRLPALFDHGLLRGHGIVPSPQIFGRIVGPPRGDILEVVQQSEFAIGGPSGAKRAGCQCGQYAQQLARPEHQPSPWLGTTQLAFPDSCQLGSGFPRGSRATEEQCILSEFPGQLAGRRPSC